MSYYLIRRARQAFIADDLDDAIVATCTVEDGKRILAGGSQDRMYHVATRQTTRGLSGMLVESMIPESEGFRCIATGSADSLKKLVEDLLAIKD